MSFHIRVAGVALACTLVAGGAHAVATSTDPAAVKAGTYVLDKAHASLLAKIGHLGFSNYTLRFSSFDASFAYDPAKPAATVVKAKIDPASVETGDAKFNAEIASEKILNAPKFPAVNFTSTKLDLKGNKGTMTGTLEFYGTSKPVTLDVTLNGVGTGMKNEERIGFSAAGSFRRSDFGFGFLQGPLSDKVDILIEAEFLKQ